MRQCHPRSFLEAHRRLPLFSLLAAFISLSSPLLFPPPHPILLLLLPRLEMKLRVDAFLSSLKKYAAAAAAKNKKKGRRAIGRADALNASSSSSSSSASSYSEEYSTATGLHATPRSVLRAAHGKAPLFLFPDEVSLLDLFNMFDCDGDGKITKRELEAVLRRLVPDPPTAEEVASMVAEMDRDGDGCISLEEFAALGPALAAGAGGGESELREAFAVFDADGDGKISAEELLGVFATLGDGGCTLEDCRRMIGGVDADGDGFVGFEDFVRMMDGQTCG
ncbi:hypothetical protein MUK42_18793 [Musa troglodytarum]|uniref:EF-hand domain-containing protein n=1 Tax=Musa troglodytarum TaxID=320322 RepID=A0A9E7KPQ0_9LILI|nr:hypothetical protein MUK42_18793 [Musa troglodytarum]